MKPENQAIGAVSLLLNTPCPLSRERNFEEHLDFL
jgi:hypothetical protein